MFEMTKTTSVFGSIGEAKKVNLAAMVPVGKYFKSANEAYCLFIQS